MLFSTFVSFFVFPTKVVRNEFDGDKKRKEPSSWFFFEGVRIIPQVLLNNKFFLLNF